MSERRSDQVEIFTDGACRGNPGPGGWGVLLCYPDREQEIYGGETDTTNNRMELMAAIMALESLQQPYLVTLTTDSKYLKNGMTQWLTNWKQRNWKTASKQPVKNQDLWRRLDKAAGQHDITWRWIKGHSGHRENQMVDMLANRGIDELSK